MASGKRVRCGNCRVLFMRGMDPSTGRVGLFGARRMPNGEHVADFDRPHVCTVKPGMDEERVRTIAGDVFRRLYTDRTSPSERTSEERLDSAAAQAIEDVLGAGAVVADGADLSSLPDVEVDVDENGNEITRKIKAMAGGTDAVAIRELVKNLIADETAGISDEVSDRVREDLVPGMRDLVRTVVETFVKPMPREVRVTIKRDGEADTRIEGHRHPQFAQLLRYVGAGMHVYLYGAPGGGKSTAARQAAEALGRNFGYLSLAPMTPESRIMGFLDVNGTFRDTTFYKCYSEGGVFCLDEADNANDALLTALNGALENKIASFPGGMVECHPDFVMVATGNTAGYGGTRGHAGRRPFDAATRERFAYIRWMYDEGLETRLATEAHADVAPWLEWVRKVRAYCSTNCPDVVVSPRASIRGAQLLESKAVESVEELAEAVLFKGLEDATRQRIVASCPYPREVRA